MQKLQQTIILLILFLISYACKETRQNNMDSTAVVSSKPNILIINIDDMGWKDVSFAGAPFYETPNIDALCNKGMRFVNGYAAAANCAPSRASLMTGKWTQRHGIFTVGNSDRGKSKDRKLIPIANTTILPDNFLILPQIFKSNGFATCHAGKWHITENPLEKGFDVNIGGSYAGHPFSYYPPYKNVDLKAAKGERLTDVVMNGAVDFIKNTEEPFFINYSPYAVHTPIQPVPSLIEKYRKKTVSSGQSNVDYATMIENLDDNIGRLIKALEVTDKLKNTFIVFTSDNGGLFAVSNQHPLRAGKGSYYEGGIRVPFFFVWDGKIVGSQKNETPISNLDIFPTLLEVAGIEMPEEESDGQSLLPILVKDKEWDDRPLFWHFPIYLQAITDKNENRDMKFRTRPGSVMRYGKWKLHHYFEDDALELYNLEDDLGEQHNLVDAEPEKAKELFEMLQEWRVRTDAPIPTEENPEFIALK